MSEKVTVGEFTLEISGDQIVVRDATGGIVETVDIDDLNGELMLPTGERVDVADLMAGQDIENLQTAAGGQPGGQSTTGYTNGGPGTFQAFRSDSSEYSGRSSAGALGGTDLDYSTLGGNTPQFSQANQLQPIIVTWASHEPWQIEENQSGGVFGKVVDGNPADFTFEVSDSRFEVVEGVLRVRNGYTFDFEDEPGIDLQITATSRTGDVQTLTTHIGVTDINEEQTSLTLDNAAVDENTAGAVIGTLTVADPDADDQQSFAVSDARFEVVNGQLKLKDGISLDHEAEGSVEVTVTATDKGGHQISQTFAIQVGDVNEAQTALTIDGSSVAENAAGAVIGTLTVADPDADDQQSFAVSDARFEVVNGQLKLKNGVSLDHEAEGSVEVTVTATDKGGHQISQAFAIQIGDVNEAPTDIDLSGNTLVENVAGAVVGSLTAIDPDASDSHTFAVSDARFEVVNGQLKLKDGVSLDFEAEPTLNVVVTATDSGGKSVQETFTLSVDGTNEAQTSLTIDNTEISENAAGAVVGTLNVMDPDAGDSQSFEVSDNRFEVVNGQLKLKDGVALDHESEPLVSVKVTATDSDGHQIAQTFAIDVADVNEAQTAMTLAGKAEVAENAAGAVVGAITVSDPDAGDAQSFKVSDDRFEVSNGQLKLKDGVALNFEAEPSVSVTVTATDAGGHEIAKTFNVGVTNVNEAQTALTLSKSTANENAKGAVIGTLTVADEDAGDKQSFTVSDSRFQVVNGQLKLKSGVSIDYESEPSVDVKVTATDKSGHQISETFKIDVADVNEKQTGITLTGNTVTENDKGAVIGTVGVSDPDAGDIQSYKVSDSRFEVVNGELKLKDGVSLNYESAATVNVKVTATDVANHSVAKTFAINVGDVNEAQTNMTLTGNKVSENAAGAVVGTLKVTDADQGDAQSFTVSDNRFEVVNGQLKLKDGVALDYEAGSKVALDVTATDMAGHQITKAYTVNVGNVWEAQTDMTLSASNVKENAAGAIIGTLKVTDPDAGDKQAYTVSDDRFEVVSNKLKLKAGVALDYEADASIDLDVTATDKGGNQITKSYTINVFDLNEAQTAITIDNNQVAENTKGAIVGTLSVADQDAGDMQSFKVSDSRFEVVNGQLKVKAGISFDHEATPSVDVTVTATDKGKHSFAQTFTVSIADVNEGQTGMALVGQQVAENAPGAVIGIVSVTDPDAGDVQSFQVSDDRFEVANGQLKLKDGISLDHEAEGTVSVTITATDKGGHQIAQTYQIEVGDANDVQTSMSIDTSHVAENAAGAVVGTITVVDQDAGDSQSFQVSDARFEVVNGQLKLKDGVTLDHESEGSVIVTVKATDQGGHEIAQDFKITVGDENEAQTGMALSGSNVAENAAGAVVGTLSVSDPDAGDSQSFQVSDSRFEVVNGALKLKDGVSLDHEAGSTVDVTVTATDGGQNQYSKTFTIGVTDVNEAQTGMSLSASKVAENSAGATIGTLATSDPDAGDAQTYTVSDSRFEVVNNQLKLKSGASLDYEAGSTVNVTVTATDKDQHQYSKSFAVTVTDVNEIAPVVVAKDGAVHSHVYDTVTTYNPTASATVGNYLYSNDSAGVKAPAASEMSAINGSNMTLQMETEVQVTFQKEAAGNRNMVGTYQYDDSGNIIPGSVKMVWLDASASTEGQLGSAMVKDFLGYQQSNTVSLGTMEAGTHVGFFTVSNGASDSANRTLLSNAATGTTSQAAAMDAIESQLSIKIDSNGNGHVYVGNTQMNGDVFFTHDKALNSDFNGSSDIVHMTSGVSSNMPGQIMIGVEDLAGGGDKDFNDVVFSVNLGSYDINKTVSNAVQPTVDFSDADSTMLSQAMIQTSGFQSGDALNIPASSLFNVQVTHTTAEYTVTITGKTGAETIDQYESFVNSISFSTSSKVEGDRHIDYSVTDNGGLKSTVDRADIQVDSDYHVSTTELGNGKATFGGGEDTLYINTSSLGPVDMGDGYDSVHLAQSGRGFDHNDAVKLSGVEELDTTGYGANKVSLSITDVLNMTDEDNQLTVIGDKGDVVTLESSGSGKWEVAGQDAEFTTYHYTDSSHEAIVQISNQLTAQIG